MAAPDFATLRRRMVERQIEARGIDDPRLLEAFAVTPREMFVAPEYASRAYDDSPLSIGEGQTISQPYIVALTIAAAQVGPEDRVLEVGAGSGYAAAILGRVARDVVSIERHSTLAESARQRIAILGLDRVAIVEGDGSQGWSARAPYDAILVAAAAPQVPPALLDQLRCPGGRLVMPLGRAGWSQQLVKLVRNSIDEFTATELCGVRFVPLISDL
ncbi:MAG: protein-L-isoaspartate(D-aspartate) O-methyltransferase [Sphingomicrobium sp.]